MIILQNLLDINDNNEKLVYVVHIIGQKRFKFQIVGILAFFLDFRAREGRKIKIFKITIQNLIITLK